MDKRHRTHEVHLRLNDKEYEALERNRRKCKLTQQGYLRFMCKNVVPREAPQADFFTCLRQLQHIGINLNQLTMVANRNDFFHSEEYKKFAQDVWSTIGNLYASIMYPEQVDRDYVQELINGNLASSESDAESDT